MTSFLTGKKCVIGGDYHVFENAGKQLFFSVDRSTVAEIVDPDLFQLLRELEQEPGVRDRVEEHVASHNWPAARRAELADALRKLQPWTYCRGGSRQQLPDKEASRGLDVRTNRLTLMISEACNLRCRYCYTGLQIDKYRTRLMSETVARAAVDLIISLSPSDRDIRVQFFGGEPLLNMDVIKTTIDYTRRRAGALKRDTHFSLTTNGTLLDEATVRYLHSQKVHVLISLDGPEWCHDRYRVYPDGRGSHAQIVRNIAFLRDHTGYLNVRATWTPGGATLVRLNEYFASIGVTLANISVAMPTNSNNSDGEFMALNEAKSVWLEQLEAVLQQCAQAWIAGQPERCPFDMLRGRLTRLSLPRSNKYNRFCGACFAAAAVGADGTIYPCHRFWPLPAFRIGNVFDGYAPDRVRAFFEQYDEAMTGQCQTCWARFLCRGVCFREAALDDGGFSKPDPAMCARIQRSWESQMGWYATLREQHPDVLEAMRKHAPQGPADRAGLGEHGA